MNKFLIGSSITVLLIIIKDMGIIDWPPIYLVGPLLLSVLWIAVEKIVNIICDSIGIGE